MAASVFFFDQRRSRDHGRHLIMCSKLTTEKLEQGVKSLKQKLAATLLNLENTLPISLKYSLNMGACER